MLLRQHWSLFWVPRKSLEAIEFSAEYLDFKHLIYNSFKGDLREKRLCMSVFMRAQYQVAIIYFWQKKSKLTTRVTPYKVRPKPLFSFLVRREMPLKKKITSMRLVMSSTNTIPSVSIHTGV